MEKIFVNARVGSGKKVHFAMADYVIKDGIGFKRQYFENVDVRCGAARAVNGQSYISVVSPMGEPFEFVNGDSISENKGQAFSEYGDIVHPKSGRAEYWQCEKCVKYWGEVSE